MNDEAPKEGVSQGRALGFVETRGLAPAIEAGDAMVKSAFVELVARQQVGGGLIAFIVRGEVGAVRAAVDAGVAAASLVGEVVAAHVIARPDESIDDLLIRPPVR